MALSAGQKLTATQYNLDVQKLGSRGRRTTASASASSATNVGVQYTSAFAVKAGYAVIVDCPNLPVRSTVAGDLLEALIRYTTDGSTPTTSSTLLPGSISRSSALITGSTATTIQLRAKYFPLADESFRALLCISRLAGTGAVSLFADGSGFMIDIDVYNAGPDPGDTGTDV
jgi:hypothetical protein